MATTNSYDALLTALALIDAYCERDAETIDTLLDGADATAVLSNVLEVTHRLLNILAVVSDDDPIDLIRHRTLEQIAAKGLDS